MAALTPFGRQRRAGFGTNFNQRYMPPPPGYSPGGMGGPNYMAMQYQGQMDAANRANEDRYNQALSEYGGLRNRSMDRIQSLGRQAANDIAAFGYDSIQGGMQDLTSRGLGGSSLGGAVRGRVQQEVGRAYGNLYDQLTQAQLGADMSTTGNIAGIMERRNDVAPDFNQMIGLSQGMGRYGGGGGYQPPASYGGYRGPMQGGPPPSLAPAGGASYRPSSQWGRPIAPRPSLAPMGGASYTTKR